ncbi:MBL fold metallo-hydrolase [Muricauda sp. NFXS6]|uniref:MBL fold metallo-hydrolase n=1 Tax=Allomuricauda sp. NFXS6 TaxID=2819094 RepID=UPI0032DEDFD4
MKNTLTYNQFLKFSSLSFLMLSLGCGAKRSVDSTSDDTIEVQLVRSATVHLDIGESSLLIDPILGGKGSQDPIPFSNGLNNPLVDLPFAVEQVLSGVDAILVTHYHPDHFDSAAEEFVPKDMLIFCQPSDKERLVEKGFTNLVAIDKQHQWAGIQISRYGASHHQGATGQPPFGESSSYGIEAFGKKVLLTGDAILDGKLKSSLDAVKPDLVIANTGECQFSEPNEVLAPGRTMTLTKEELVQLAVHRPMTKVVAVHLEAINHCILTREVLRGYVREKGLEESIMVPSDGESLSF